MTAGPARASAAYAPASAPAPVDLDPLSDVLRTVRLTGALFFLVDATSPWTVTVPDGATLAPAILPHAQHIISYHVVREGSCWGRLRDGPPVRLQAGDILVLPRGDPYTMSMTRAASRGPDHAEVLAFLRQVAASQLPFTVVEGGGGAERLHLVCGFLGCDIRPFNPLLATLPPLLHVRPPAAPVDRLVQLLDFTVAESREPRPGGDSVRLRLSELLFVEVVRRHLAGLPAGQKGWLAGLRDPLVGRAVAFLHERPADSWTLHRLARGLGTSRSTLAARFARFVGLPPMQYLTRWRMQLAARRLGEGDAKVSAVALEVGYDSEAAFSRAFKRVAGVPPAAWRRRRTARPPAAAGGDRASARSTTNPSASVAGRSPR